LILKKANRLYVSLKYRRICLQLLVNPPDIHNMHFILFMSHSDC